MSFSVEWLPGHEGRIILQTLVGHVTVELVAAASEEVGVLLDQGIAPVHMVVDVNAVTTFTPHATQMKKAGAHLLRPSMGWITLVGASPIMITFINIVTQLAGIKLRNFASLDEALDFILQKDPTVAGYSSK